MADPSAPVASDAICATPAPLLLSAAPVRPPLRLAAAVAAAVVLFAPRVHAASVSVEAPVRVAEGWTRAAGHYESDGADPSFRAVARCGADTHVLYSIVHLSPGERVLWLDLPGTPERLVPADVACASPEVWLEMVVDAKVVASAALPDPDTVGAGSRAAAPGGATTAPSRVRLNGQKYGSKVGGRTEAGVAVALDKHLSLQLNYARTAQVPLMPYATDNGILARLRFGF